MLGGGIEKGHTVKAGCMGKGEKARLSQGSADATERA